MLATGKILFKLKLEYYRVGSCLLPECNNSKKGIGAPASGVAKFRRRKSEQRKPQFLTNVTRTVFVPSICYRDHLSNSPRLFSVICL